MAVLMRSLRENFEHTLNAVRKASVIEPGFVCFLIGVLLLVILKNWQLYDAACMETLNFNITMCTLILGRYIDNSTQLAEFDIQIQGYIDDVLVWIKPVSVVITFGVVSTSCALSDLLQLRKPFIIIAILGEILSTVRLFMCYLYGWCSVQLLAITDRVVLLFGGKELFWAMSFVYMIQNTTLENRTSRLFLLQASKITVFITSFYVTSLVDSSSVQAYMVTFIFFLLTLLYFVYVVKEKRPEQEMKWDKSVLRKILICSVIAEAVGYLRKMSAKKVLVLVVVYLIFFAKNSWADGFLTICLRAKTC